MDDRMQIVARLILLLPLIAEAWGSKKMINDSGLNKQPRGLLLTSKNADIRPFVIAAASLYNVLYPINENQSVIMWKKEIPTAPYQTPCRQLKK